MDHSTGKDLPSVSVESFENLPGRGLFATLSSIEVVFHINIWLNNCLCYPYLVIKIELCSSIWGQFSGLFSFQLQQNFLLCSDLQTSFC